MKGWNLLERYVETVGADHALRSLALALGDSKLLDLLKWIVNVEDVEEVINEEN